MDNPSRIRFPPINFVVNGKEVAPQNVVIRAQQQIERKFGSTRARLNVLDEQVARAYFERVTLNLEKKAEYYTDRWKINKLKFPIALVDVFASNGERTFILSLNYRNYNFYPPEVKVLNENLEVYLGLPKGASTPDPDGVDHLIADPRGVWICTRGTFEFHDWYYDLDRWELIRGSEDDDIVVLIEWVLSFFNLSKTLNELIADVSDV